MKLEEVATRAPDDVHARMAQRVGALRAERGLSLETLAARCGVSRSMISLIERGETSPTAVVLEKLSAGLGVSLASLFEAEPAEPSPLSRRGDQPVWRDPESGYVRRNVSPAGLATTLQIVEVEFPAGGRVTLEGGPREPALHQQIWLLEGRLELVRGERVDRLEAGDCLAMRMGGPIVFRNPTRKPARYAVVIAAEGATPLRR